MRSVGCGPAAATAKRFCGLMNIPPPPPTPYASHNKALLKATKDVCFDTMSIAAQEIHDIQEKPHNEVTECGV